MRPEKTRECPSCGAQADYQNKLSMLYGWHYICKCGYSFWWGLMQARV